METIVKILRMTFGRLDRIVIVSYLIMKLFVKLIVILKFYLIESLPVNTVNITLRDECVRVNAFHDTKNCH